MISPLMPLFPIIVVIILVIIFSSSVQIVKGSVNATMGIGVPNSTLPEINDYENDNKDTNSNTQTQNWQMPPCPPGEMCIQVCPESVPR
jgi:divalent metal cation (Fe/Co/Zn/Cd) transporter